MRCLFVERFQRSCGSFRLATQGDMASPLTLGFVVEPLRGKDGNRRLTKSRNVCWRRSHDNRDDHACPVAYCFQAAGS